MKRVAAAPFRVGQQQQQQQQHKKKKKRGREICEGQPKFLRLVRRKSSTSVRPSSSTISRETQQLFISFFNWLLKKGRGKKS
jgi:hypothetical protein